MKKQESIMLLEGSGYNILCTPEAEQLKLNLLKQSATVLSVHTVEESNAIRETTLKSLADFRIKLEKTRKEIKQPIVELGRQIDDLAKNFGDKIIHEEKRIGGILGDFAFQMEQERLRIERERQVQERERLRLEYEAEQAKIKAEQSANAKPLSQLKAEREAEAKRVAAEAAAEESRQLAIESAELTKQKGTVFQSDFLVENVNALMEFNRSLVDIIPSRQRILNQIEVMRGMAGMKGEDPDKITIPGLKLMRVAKVR